MDRRYEIAVTLIIIPVFDELQLLRGTMLYHLDKIFLVISTLPL